MTNDHITALLTLADRLVTLAEKRWATTEVEAHAEVWKQGEPGPKAETAEEYRNLTPSPTGRFTELVRKHGPPPAG